MVSSDEIEKAGEYDTVGMQAVGQALYVVQDGEVVLGGQHEVNVNIEDCEAVVVVCFYRKVLDETQVWLVLLDCILVRKVFLRNISVPTRLGLWLQLNM